MIAIITARKGSTRCPNKNVMPFNDQPNIVIRTIEQARWLKSDYIWVTTDYFPQDLSLPPDDDLLYRKRPAELCEDCAKSEDAVLDVLNESRQHFKTVDDGTFVLMQPTSPIRRIDTLTRAKAKFDRGDIPALVSVGPNHSPNGSFYFVKTDVFLKEKTFFPKGCHFWMCSAEESVDINMPWDFRIAEAVARGDVHG